jgi:hypothetical protein
LFLAQLRCKTNSNVGKLIAGVNMVPKYQIGFLVRGILVIVMLCGALTKLNVMLWNKWINLCTYSDLINIIFEEYLN